MEIDLEKEASVIINLLKAQKFDEVINKAAMLNKKFPDQVFFYNALSLSYNGVKKYQKSLDILQKGLKKNSKDIFLLNNLGLTYYRMGDEEQALKNFEQALQINPKFLDAHVNLAEVKKSQKKNSEAIEILNMCLDANPNNYVLNFALANNYQDIGKFVEAKIKYKFNMKESWMIGDKEADIIAANSAGINKTILVQSGHDISKANSNAKYILKSIHHSVQTILD